MIKMLPHWVLTNRTPGFYDSESGSTLEQTAKVYKAMQELQEEYNKFVSELEKSIEEFENSTNQDLEKFKKDIIKIESDFISCVDSKIEVLNVKVDEAISYMKENLGVYVQQVVDEMRENGELSETILNTFDNIDERVNTLEANLVYTYNTDSEGIVLPISSES